MAQPSSKFCCSGMNNEQQLGFSTASMLHVKIVFRLFYFGTSYFFFQARSDCFNLDRFGAGETLGSQATSHWSLLANS